MAARNSERLINLVIALLVTPRFISRTQIRELVEGYSQAKSEVAFLRMFERDKEDLRAMGIEVLVGPTDPYSDEMDGYRIRPDDYYLPEINLTPQESTIVGLAGSVWSQPQLAASVGSALAKLRAAGEEITSQQVSYLTPAVAAREAGFPILWEALLARALVCLRYHGRDRQVQGWKLVHRLGIWYLLGKDLVAGARVFRLSRIEGLPRVIGEPGSYVMPNPEVIAELTASLEPPKANQEVWLAIRTETAANLYRRGYLLTTQVPEGFEAVAVPYSRDDEIVSAICAAGPDVLVISPDNIKDQVIAQLRTIAALPYEGREST